MTYLVGLLHTVLEQDLLAPTGPWTNKTTKDKRTAINPQIPLKRVFFQSIM